MWHHSSTMPHTRHHRKDGGRKGPRAPSLQSQTRQSLELSHGQNPSRQLRDSQIRPKRPLPGSQEERRQRAGCWPSERGLTGQRLGGRPCGAGCSGVLHVHMPGTHQDVAPDRWWPEPTPEPPEAVFLRLLLAQLWQGTRGSEQGHSKCTTAGRSPL